MNGRVLALTLTLSSALLASGKRPPPPKAPAEMEQLKFLTGRWRCVVKVHATADGSPERSVTSYLSGAASAWSWNPFNYTQAGKDDGLLLVQGYIGWDANAKKFVFIGVTNSGNSLRSTSDGWQDGKLVWSGEGPTLSGTALPSRSTYSMKGDDEMDILSEASGDGGAAAWTAVRESHCKRTR